MRNIEDQKGEDHMTIVAPYTSRGGAASPPAGLLAREYLRRESGLLVPDLRIKTPLQAAIGTPTIVLAPASYSNNTTSAAIVAGNLVVVAVCIGGNNRTCTGVSDGTNTYTKALSLCTGAGSCPDVSLWYVQNASALSSGATITAGISGGAPTQIIAAAQVSGVATTSSFDTTGAGASNPTASVIGTPTASPSVTTGTLSQANEIIFGVTGSETIETYTEDANFTNLFAASFVGHANSLSLGYRIVSSTAPVTFAPTLSASANWVALAAPFQGVYVAPPAQIALQIKRRINIRR
jgi:hypothetical protein